MAQALRGNFLLLLVVTSVLTAGTAWWMSTYKPFDDAPGRQHKAGVHIRVEEEYAEISALLQDKKGNETAKIPLMHTLPHYMFIYKFIHTTKWLDKERFQVRDKSGQVLFGVNVPEEKASMQLLPKTMGLAELVKEVGMAVAEEW